MKLTLALLTGLLSLVAGASNGHAASILHLSEDRTFGRSAIGIPGILTADGHTVTTVTDGPGGTGYAQIAAALNGDLSSYDVLLLDLYDLGGSGATEAASIASFLASGGRVLATGYDSGRGTTWGNLLHPLIGNAPGSATDLFASPGAVANIASSLTTGVIDIRGLTPPTGGQDFDRLNGPLAADTIQIVSISGGSLWTLRQPVSGGEIAYLSSPLGYDFSTDPVYSGALRNFVGAATPIPEPSSLALGFLGLSSLGMVAWRRRKRAGRPDPN